MWLTSAPRLSRIAINPSYAPPFHDLSEIGPGVSNATLKGFPAAFAGSLPDGAHALIVNATTAEIHVDKSLSLLGSARVSLLAINGLGAMWRLLWIVD